LVGSKCVKHVFLKIYKVIFRPDENWDDDPQIIDAFPSTRLNQLRGQESGSGGKGKREATAEAAERAGRGQKAEAKTRRRGLGFSKWGFNHKKRGV
jgi:hypothetical protein